MQNTQMMNQMNFNHEEVRKYVATMQKYGITTIVKMNSLITKHKLWDHFSSLKTLNTYRNSGGEVSIIGVSKEAYKAILSQYQTCDVVTSRLISQERV